MSTGDDSLLMPAPVLIPGQVDSAVAVWLARVAVAAYHDHVQIEAAWAGLPTRFIEDPQTHTQAWIGVLPEQQAAVLAFRGSESVPEDWLLNADFRRRDNPWWPQGGRVHSGFLRGYAAVSDQIDQALHDLGDPQALWLCGHSLGGALATLAAAHRQAAGKAVAGVLTIGQPRVGDRDFASAYTTAGLHQRHIRVANIRDPVTRVPPSMLGWAHVGERWLFNRGGKRITTPRWYHYLVDFVASWLWGSNERRAYTAIHAYVAAHGGERYIANLAKQVQDNDSSA